MSETSDQRSQDFLKISAQFKLGALVTESSHPVTAQLSEVARENVARALDLLFQVDEDVLAKYREFVQSGRAAEIQAAVLRALKKGGRVFFTGCGSTGRLSILLVSVWRGFWQERAKLDPAGAAACADWEQRALSVMAGGDYALIKSVEGFEDFTAFGRKQMADLGVSGQDVVFAITEGGETSFVIGTAWQGVDAGAKVYFVYNNPDAILCEHVERSREVITDRRIEKLNLTTGPMAVTGSTRMQATSIQLCVLLTVLEMVVRELTAMPASAAENVPSQFAAHLRAALSALRSPAVLSGLAAIEGLEESVYRSAHRNNYYADRFGIDVLTDTTERSPTYCTPPFRKFDDVAATESWSFLFRPEAGTPRAWERILKREPRCVEWTEAEVKQLVEAPKLARTCEIIRNISRVELMRFRIGLDGLSHRAPRPGDSAVMIGAEEELESGNDFFPTQLQAASQAGARTAAIVFGSGRRPVSPWTSGVSHLVPVSLPRTDFLLDGVTRVAVKLLLNALSTCTMVRLGRVMGNYMIWVVPSNLKLIDRATRYIQKLTDLAYPEANRLLFEVIEYVEPRMKSDRAYPPVVGMAVLRHREKLTNEAAEKRLLHPERSDA